MSSKIIKYGSFILFVAINLLFVAKYGYRVTSMWPAVAVVYVLVLIFLFPLDVANRFSEYHNRLLQVGLIALSVAVLIAYQFIPQEALRVDRYEMIRLFWDNISAGINPYTPRQVGTNIPGPFPVYFYLAGPFYLMGELGLYTLSGVAILLVVGFKLYPDSKDRFTFLLLLLASVGFAWEVAVRSTLVLNTAFALAFVILDRKWIAEGKSFFVSALAFGLVMSTRSVMIVVLLPAILYRFKASSLLESAKWALVAGLTFGMTFVPMMFFDTFYTGFNPIVVQGIFVPKSISLLVIVGVLVAGYRCTSISQQAFTGALAVIVLVSVYVGYEVADHGLFDVFIGDRADISYYLLSLPLLIIGYLGEANSTAA